MSRKRYAGTLGFTARVPAGLPADPGIGHVCLQPLRLSAGAGKPANAAMPAVLQSDTVEGAFHPPLALMHGTNRQCFSRSVDRGGSRPCATAGYLPDQQQEQTVAATTHRSTITSKPRASTPTGGDRSEARTLSRAVDELVAAIRLLMRNSTERTTEPIPSPRQLTAGPGETRHPCATTLRRNRHPGRGHRPVRWTKPPTPARCFALPATRPALCGRCAARHPAPTAAWKVCLFRSERRAHP